MIKTYKNIELFSTDGCKRFVKQINYIHCDFPCCERVVAQETTQPETPEGWLKIQWRPKNTDVYICKCCLEMIKIFTKETEEVDGGE